MKRTTQQVALADEHLLPLRSPAWRLCGVVHGRLTGRDLDQGWYVRRNPCTKCCSRSRVSGRSAHRESGYAAGCGSDQVRSRCLGGGLRDGRSPVRRTRRRDAWAWEIEGSRMWRARATWLVVLACGVALAVGPAATAAVGDAEARRVVQTQASAVKAQFGSAQSCFNANSAPCLQAPPTRSTSLPGAHEPRWWGFARAISLRESARGSSGTSVLSTSRCGTAPIFTRPLCPSTSLGSTKRCQTCSTPRSLSPIRRWCSFTGGSWMWIVGCCDCGIRHSSCVLVGGPT